jgi:hypothetical protein
MRDTKSYKEIEALVKSYKSIGQTEHHLSEGDFPWQWAYSCEEGGSHRLDISTNVWFRAKSPITGMEYRWTFDIEPWSANGSTMYQIDVVGCRKVLASLPDGVKVIFKGYLTNCARSVEKRAQEYYEFYKRQHDDAEKLLEAAQ